MAFFASPERDIYEHRLRRSTSVTSVRTRIHRPSGSEKPPSRSRVDPPRPLHRTPDVPSAECNMSRAVVPAPVPRSSSPSPSPREHTIPDLKSSFKPLQVSVPSSYPQPSDGVSPGSDSMLHPKSGQRQPHPSTPSPSASCKRSKLMIDAGSVSDSGITSCAARSSRYLDVSFAHKGGVSLLDLRHRSPSSPCLSLPGYLSDSCTLERSSTSLHPSRLDVKRLLSKPAALSAVSTVSISSDPGSHATPRSAPNSAETWPSKARIQSPARESTVGPPTSLGADLPRVDQSQTQSPPSSRQRPRNLLRKKSTSGQSLNQTRAVTSATVPSDMSISSPLQSPTHPPDTALSRKQRSTTLQSLIRSRASVPASAPPSGSGRLTPAGAIIQAYKEQDNRREALAAAASIEKSSPIIPISAAWVDTSDDHAPEPNGVPPAECAPRHIELGRSPDSFVMVDGPSDLGYGDRSASPNAGQPIKSLTRKVSARFRRGLAAVSGAGAQSGRGHDDGEGEQMNRHRSNTDDRDRRERQLSSEPHNAKHKPESLRLSIDSPPPSTPSSGLIDPWDEHSGRTPQVESALNSPNAFTQSKGKEKMHAKVETGTGTKLWRLVKRISTGALRERFQTASAAPPPLPALLKPLPDLPPRTTFEVRMPSGSFGGVEGAGPSDVGHDGGKSVKNCHVDSNPSASGVASHGDGYSSTVAYVPPGTHASSQGHGAGEHPRRPSLSSSPQSSEPTFFRSHSSRSSFSSIIVNSPPPPVPIHPLTRSPSPRTRLPAKNSPSPSTRRTSYDESPSSSLPRTRMRGRSSPEMSTFSVSDVVNNFILRRPSLARHQRHHAPTRSMVFPRTTGDMGAGVPLRRTGSEVRRTTRERPRAYPISMAGSSGQNRDSHGSDMTVRHLATSTGTPSAAANADDSVEPFTFRELGSERKQAWTSQEKEDKWHALLERSAQAGGTLHLGVGGAGLASDNIRFSSSTISFSSESSASALGEG